MSKIKKKYLFIGLYAKTSFRAKLKNFKSEPFHPDLRNAALKTK